MKKYLPLLLLFGMGSVVHAGGLSTRHSTSLQYTVDGGHTEYTRMGNSYSISGTNVTTTHGTGNDAVTGGLGVNSYNATTVLDQSVQSQQVKEQLTELDHFLSHNHSL